jgi:tetratricopeptide (TPR) repeat protein
MILQRAGRTDEVQQLQTEVVDSNWDNADQLNEIAWSIATGPQPGDLTLAMRAAERANELTDASNASILDTLARVHYELGDLDAAIQWQQKAVAAEPNLDSLAETLRRYQTEKD